MDVMVDKEVKFDIPFSDMKLRNGEKIIDKMDMVEDTKGNSGDKGRFIVTNLRVLWYSTTTPRISLSIGYNCIINSSTKTVSSKVCGTTKSLYVLALSNNVRFEFIFTNLIPGSVRDFSSVIEVYRLYVASTLYRELKMRGAIVFNKQLKLLPQEQIYTTQHGVWNLSSDQGNLGTFVVTNVRMVWFADINEGFNISLPYLQMSNVVLRESKFGMALVITSSPQSGAYVLGFKMDPEERLQTVYKELTSLYTVYSKNPIYGVEYEGKSSKNVFEQTSLVEDLEETEDQPNEMSNTLTAYLTVESHVKDREIVYNNELGLAIENLKDNLTLQKLWEVIPNDKIYHKNNFVRNYTIVKPLKVRKYYAIAPKYLQGPSARYQAVPTGSHLRFKYLALYLLFPWITILSYQIYNLEMAKKESIRTESGKKKFCK